MISRLKKKAIAVLMMFVMAASLVFVLGPTEVNAATGSYKMPSRVRTYAYKNGKWKKTNDRTFKYDSKGNVTNWDGTVLNLSYNGNKLKKVTVETQKNTPEHCKTTKTYNSKGYVTKIVYNYLEWMKVTARYKYNKKGYIKSRSYTDDYDDEGNEILLTEKYKIEYYANGMPKKITRTTDYNDEKIIEKYNKKGFCKSAKTYEGKKLVQSYTVDFEMQGNVIKSAVENYTIKDGKKSNYKWKYVYTYGNAKNNSKKQYAAFMSMTHNTFLFQTVGNNSAVGWCR